MCSKNETAAFINERLQCALAQKRNYLLEHESYEILSSAGLRVPANIFFRPGQRIDTEELKEVPGDKVVCKLISPGMPHRTEYHGIRFVEKNHRKIAKILNEFEEIAKRAQVEFSGMMIAEVIPGKDCIPYQLLLSARQDSAFGPIVFCGLGGLGTELYEISLKSEKGLSILPAWLIKDRIEVDRILSRSLFYPMVMGKTRVSEAPLVNLESFFGVLETFGWLAERFSSKAADTEVTIEEIEVNPLQITPAGELVPLDALIRISTRKHSEQSPPLQLVDRLMKPKSALVIGASATKINTGRIILRNLIKGGGIPKDKIFCLHPEASEIDGCKALKSMSDLEEKVDMTIFTVPADEKALEMIEEMIESEKTSTLTIISSGFAETQGGRSMEERLRATIRKTRERPTGGVAVNGPNCMGIVSKPGGYNTFFIPEYKLPFLGKHGNRCAVISQSGAYIVTLVSNLGRFFNPKYMITFGNQIDIGVADYLLSLEKDPEVELFVVYLEGFKPGDGERFLSVARKIVQEGRNMIFYKAGRTEAGAKAIASHTASMAGDFKVMRRLMEEIGVMVMDDLDSVEDAIKAFVLLSDRKPEGKRAGIFSNAGFECSVAADNLGTLELASFCEDTVSKLRQALPADIIDVHNPVDATPVTNAINYGRCLEAILGDDGVDCLLASNVAPTPFMENLPAGEGYSENILHENSYPNVTIRVFNSTSKPMIVCLNSGPLYDPAVRMMEDAGIPCYRKIDRAMKALGLFVDRTLRSSRRS